MYFTVNVCCNFGHNKMNVFKLYLDHIVMADKDGVLLQLCDGDNVHQLVAWHHSLRPISLFQLITGDF